jgi:hypothetical protein
MSQASSETPGGVARWLGWLISPTFYYLLVFLMTTALALSLYNPYWGPAAPAWAHQVFTLDGGSAWGSVQAQAAALLVAIALSVLGLLLPSGRRRGQLMLFTAGLLLVGFQSAASELNYWILPLATGAVASCLVLRREGSAASRKTVLLIAMAVLGANLFLPWSPERIAGKHLKPGYYSTASAQIHVMIDPPDELLVEAGPGDEREQVPVTGYLRMLLMSLPALVGTLMFVLGIASLLGLGRGWLRWVAGPALLVLVLGTAFVLYDHGSGRTVDGGPEAWQEGLSYWGRMWASQGAGWVLLLAGAITELVRRPND